LSQMIARRRRNERRGKKEHFNRFFTAQVLKKGSKNTKIKLNFTGRGV
jgi:hypothetical protein